MNRLPHSTQVSLVRFLATGFGSGRLPIMPGTCGSICAFVLVVGIQKYFPGFADFHLRIFTALLLLILGIWFVDYLLQSGLYGDEQKDPQEIVIDEFAGYAVAIIGVGTDIFQLFVALILFRIFDIGKPPPIRRIERLPGGKGVMLDDIAAGFLACLVAQIFFVFWIE